jgi:histidinol-phosphate/aromatic aminotransferase/cobyric acid decarboxylase-like protein
MVDPDFIECYLRDVRRFYGENSASDDVVKLCAQAADEMDRMLDDVSELAERFDAACMERNKVLTERDDARIQFCMMQVENDMHDKVMSTPEQVASEYGWDYLIPLMENK